MPTTALPPSQVLEGETLLHEAVPTLDAPPVDLTGLAPGRYLVAQADGRSRVIPLLREVAHVGRGFHADVRLDDHAVSRSHAIVVVRAGRARVLDDRSANGTYVNGRRIDEAVLTDGDVVVVGGVVLTYRELSAGRVG